MEQLILKLVILLMVSLLNTKLKATKDKNKLQIKLK